MAQAKEILNSDEISSMITRLVFQILEADQNQNTRELTIVGIKRGGATLADRLKEEIKKHTGRDIAIGYLCITLYRDDLTQIAEHPVIHGTEIEFNIAKKHVVLVDDVIFTGRTVRAALDALTDMGRPDKISFVALIDRGHRELPIQPDFTGKLVPTSLEEKVNVQFKESDGIDSVSIMKKDQ
ncbi:bifunctional pyr operon transcriptional regulator/uracil phosphoribosyltransferase PyrR [Limisalsivibrio acetivorans]|uniref:bifunctional pyr operon transcriptional regulator/uracil phosphoribosyltransferase PyrR n=1 Tax=Limisalsivibrio acetivorans TaxID=1304888 RepID=UPI0003B44902|nr:bifunctional pyr operon transcriptional regulator/uracil phosphoribosyltransferase PyrR [Limisalsivibrio acetivorans]